MSHWRFHKRRPEDGQTWGNWRLVVGDKFLAYTGSHNYGIPLRRIRSSAELADWVFQVNMKAWCSPEDAGNLVKALDAVFYPQANLCSGGNDKELDAEKYLDELFSAAISRK